MKKDKLWAKLKIRKELESWQNIEGGIDEDGINYVLNIIDQVDEPGILSQELPVLPKHVADWIEESREFYKNNALNIGYDLYDNAIHPAVDNWIIMNEEKFMRAWLDGYRITEEQKYYIDLDTAAYVAKWNGNGQVGIYTDSISGKDEFELHLTEEEIKNYDERFWPFAVPVEVAE